jgi:eukaryotic-like serine/threonine-protein kinase
MTGGNLATLRRNLVTHFTLAELRGLCLDLGIDHENLPAESKEDLSRELILFLARRQRLVDMVALAGRLRPELEWPMPSDAELVNLLATGPVETPTSTLSASAGRSRQPLLILLDKVYRFWIEGVLAHSLAAGRSIELDWQFAPLAVDQPWQGIAAPLATPGGRKGPTPTDWYQLFQDSGRALLILGPAGSGKTTTLLRLTEALISAAQADPAEPIPVVLNLSSWAAGQSQIGQWVEDELAAKYQIPRHLSRQWLARDQLILLLDGLDEVPDRQRPDCITALNAFREGSGLTGLAVCSRDRAYAAAGRKLRLGLAIGLQPLSPDQVRQFLNARAVHLTVLRHALEEDQELQEMARLPLMLSIMSQTYQDTGQGDSTLHPSSLTSSGLQRRRERLASFYQQLFHDFCRNAFQRRGLTGEDAGRMQAGMGWLARRLAEHNQSVFFIEQIQPSWLDGRRWQWFYLLVSRLAAGLAIGLIMALFTFNLWLIPVNLLVGLLLGLIYCLLFEHRRSQMAAGRFQQARDALMFGLITAAAVSLLMLQLGDEGQAAGLYWGLINGSAYALAAFFIFGRRFDDDIRVVVGLSWSWSGALTFLPLGLLFGLVLGWLAQQAFGFITQQRWSVALETAVLNFLFGGLRHRHLSASSQPNEGLRRAWRNAVLAGTLFGLLNGLVVGLFNANLGMGSLGVVRAIQYAFGASLIFGGFFLFNHLLLRIILLRQGHIPRRYARFLDLAASLNFLRKVGGGYLFNHRLLQDYFAAQPEGRHQATS